MINLLPMYLMRIITDEIVRRELLRFEPDKEPEDLDSDDDETYPPHLNETEESEPDQLDQY